MDEKITDTDVYKDINYENMIKLEPNITDAQKRTEYFEALNRRANKMVLPYIERLKKLNETVRAINSDTKDIQKFDVLGPRYTLLDKEIKRIQKELIELSKDKSKKHKKCPVDDKLDINMIVPNNIIEYMSMDYNSVLLKNALTLQQLISSRAQCAMQIINLENKEKKNIIKTEVSDITKKQINITRSADLNNFYDTVNNNTKILGGMTERFKYILDDTLEKLAKAINDVCKDIKHSVVGSLNASINKLKNLRNIITCKKDGKNHETKIKTESVIKEATQEIINIQEQLENKNNNIDQNSKEIFSKILSDFANKIAQCIPNRSQQR